jgi:hypothetical protein
VLATAPDACDGRLVIGTEHMQKRCVSSVWRRSLGEVRVSGSAHRNGQKLSERKAREQMKAVG